MLLAYIFYPRLCLNITFTYTDADFICADGASGAVLVTIFVAMCHFVAYSVPQTEIIVKFAVILSLEQNWHGFRYRYNVP